MSVQPLLPLIREFVTHPVIAPDENATLQLGVKPYTVPAIDLDRFFSSKFMSTHNPTATGTDTAPNTGTGSRPAADDAHKKSNA